MSLHKEAALSILPFQLDEDALPIGAWLHAACAEAWLSR